MSYNYITYEPTISYITYEPTISDTETFPALPRGVPWFIDRTGDPMIVDYFNILAINHRQFQLTKFVEVTTQEDMKVTEEECECCVCMEKKDTSEICRINCAHTFCIDCCIQTMAAKFRRQESMTCPLCRVELTSILVKNMESKDKFIETNP